MTRTSSDGRRVVRLEELDPDGRLEAPDIDVLAELHKVHIVRAPSVPQGPLLPPPSDAATESVPQSS